MVLGTILHFNPEPAFAESRSDTSRARTSVRFFSVISVEVNADPGPVNPQTQR
jgi:hypothetical protein